MDRILSLFFFFSTLLFVSNDGHSPSIYQATDNIVPCEYMSVKDKPPQMKPCIQITTPPESLINADDDEVSSTFNTLALNCSTNTFNMSECMWFSTSQNTSQYLRFIVPQNRTGLYEELKDLHRICPFLDKPDLTLLDISEITDSSARLTWTFPTITSMSDLDYEITNGEPSTRWLSTKIPTQNRLIKNSNGASLELTDLYAGTRYQAVIRAIASASWLRSNCRMNMIEPVEWARGMAASFKTKRLPISVNVGTFSIDKEINDTRIIRTFWKYDKRKEERCNLIVYEEDKPVKSDICDDNNRYLVKISNKRHRIEIQYTNRTQTAKNVVVVPIPAKENILNSNFTFAVVNNGSGLYEVFWPHSTNVTIQAKFLDGSKSHLMWMKNDANTDSMTFYSASVEPLLFSMSENSPTSSTGLKLSSCALSSDEELIILQVTVTCNILYLTLSYACPRLPDILNIERILLVLCRTQDYECIEDTSERYIFNSEASDILLTQIESEQLYKIVAYGLSKHNKKVESNEFHFVAHAENCVKK